MEFESKRIKALVIRSAKRVLKALGPSHSEAVYQNALMIELGQHKTPDQVLQTEVIRPITYKGHVVGHCRFDIKFGNFIVECKVSKTNSRNTPQFTSQIYKYKTLLKSGENSLLVVFSSRNATVYDF